jgi:hypothetical protein
MLDGGVYTCGNEQERRHAVQGEGTVVRLITQTAGGKGVHGEIMKAKRGIVSTLSTLAPLVGLIVGVAHAVEPTTTGDLFDVNLGAIVTDSSPGTITPAANMLGDIGGVESSNLIFGDGQPAGTVLFVEWEVTTGLPLAGFNLRIIDDGQNTGVDFARSLDHVRLLADSGAGFEAIYDADVAIPYNDTPEQDPLLISTMITPVAAQRFRAEFTQALTCTFCGPRIVELDGFPVNACADGNYSGTTTASDALIALTTSIGLSGCPLCACDVDGGGSVTATDALAILTTAVGLPFGLNCPACL